MEDVGRRRLEALRGVQVICDDCGSIRWLSEESIHAASEAGLETYRDLCFHIRCAECPVQPIQARNLNLRPAWKQDGVDQTIA